MFKISPKMFKLLQSSFTFVWVVAANLVKVSLNKFKRSSLVKTKKYFM